MRGRPSSLFGQLSDCRDGSIEQRVQDTWAGFIKFFSEMLLVTSKLGFS
jgi:hypothetical protein